MIKFFRRIRYRLLIENRFTRYLLYAIGEIVLVVLGILIALEINNQNELRKNELIVNMALQETQSNLLSDIIEAQENLDQFLVAYSTEKKIFDYRKPLTLADYKDQNIDIIGYNYSTFKINKDGYENLMRHLDKFPITYNAILNDLKFLYGDLYIMIQVYNERLRNTVYRQIDFSHTQNWDIHRRRFSTISNDELYYYYENDAYKRHVLKYMNDRSWVYRGSQRYRTNAIEAYMKIDSLLDENDRELPFNLLGMVESSFEVEKFIGNYKSVDSTITNTIHINLKNHHLYSNDNQGNKFKHYRIDDKRYFFMTSTKNNGYPVVWEFNNNTDGCIVINFLNAEIPMLKKVD